MNLRWLAYFAIACLLILSACDSATSPQSTPSLADAAAQTAGSESHWISHESIPPTSIDAKFLDIERQVPGFAGLYNAGDGLLQAFVQEDAIESTDPDELRAVIEGVMGDFSSLASVRGEASVDALVELVPVDFSFSQLSDTRVNVLEVLTLDGVHTVDVNEMANRVRIFADGEFAVLDAQAFAEEKNLPMEAIEFTDAPQPERMATLRDRVRWLRGGLQIAFDGSLCTLGFIAERDGVRGFVTNAHCSTTMFSATSTYYYQPSRTIGNYIGYEIVDPPLYSGSYRYSDAALVRITSSENARLGRIWSTESWKYQTGSGSITIDGEVEIDREDCNVTTGDFIDKIGRTTGWTYGRVESTCQTVNMGSYTLYCQDEVYAGSDRGDSGSPTFRWKGDTDGDGRDNADLTGLLWGGRTYPSGKKTFLYSPMCQVETDLGSLRTY